MVTDAIKVDIEAGNAIPTADKPAQTGSLKGRVVKALAAVGIAGVISAIAWAAIKSMPIWGPAFMSFAVTPPGLFVLSFLVTVVIGVGIGVLIYLLVKKMRQPSLDDASKLSTTDLNSGAEVLQNSFQEEIPFQEAVNGILDTIPKKIETTHVQHELENSTNSTDQADLDKNRTGYIQGKEITTENPIVSYLPKNASPEFMTSFNQFFTVPSYKILAEKVGQDQYLLMEAPSEHTAWNYEFTDEDNYEITCEQTFYVMDIFHPQVDQQNPKSDYAFPIYVTQHLKKENGRFIEEYVTWSTEPVAEPKHRPQKITSRRELQPISISKSTKTTLSINSPFPIHTNILSKTEINSRELGTDVHRIGYLNQVPFFVDGADMVLLNRTILGDRYEKGKTELPHEFTRHFQQSFMQLARSTLSPCLYFPELPLEESIETQVKMSKQMNRTDSNSTYDALLEKAEGSYASSGILLQDRGEHVAWDAQFTDENNYRIICEVPLQISNMSTGTKTPIYLTQHLEKKDGVFTEFFTWSNQAHMEPKNRPKEDVVLSDSTSGNEDLSSEVEPTPSES